mmetsp:Transcript_21049/g.31455  ORF Transcript_21049/g.31455 Transcript_21049/m.31455 type:complete len:86 (-) Transcript_21049:43-300(-)
MAMSMVRGLVEWYERGRPSGRDFSEDAASTTIKVNVLIMKTNFAQKLLLVRVCVCVCVCLCSVRRLPKSEAFVVMRRSSPWMICT